MRLGDCKGISVAGAAKSKCSIIINFWKALMVAAFNLNEETFYHFALFEKNKQELFIKINHFFPFSIQNYLSALRRRKEKQWRQSKKERNFNIFWCPDIYISSLRLCAHTIFFDLFNVRAKITWITIDSPITFLFRCFFALSLSLSLRLWFGTW